MTPSAPARDSEDGPEGAPERPGPAVAKVPGGVIERYPGPALLVGPNGLVLQANPAAEPIANLLRGGGGAAVRQASDAALGGTTAQVTPLLLAAPGGAGGAGGRAYDLVALPWGDGATSLLLARDITLERSLRAALIESRQRYKDLVEAAADFAWETDAEGRFTFVSPGGALGYAASDLVGGRARDLQVDATLAEGSPFTTRTRVQEVELWVQQRAAEPACLLVTALPLFDAEGAWRGARGLCRDITAGRRHEARLAVDRHRERMFGYILGILRDEVDPGRMAAAACGALVPALPASGAAIYRHDRAGDLVCAAQAGEQPGADSMAALMRRIAEGEGEVELVGAEGLLFGKATHFDDAWNGAICLWRAGAARPLAGDDRVLLAEIAAQIGLTNRQLAHNEELEALSTTDPLTGLHNRRSLLAELERRGTRRAAWRGGAALYFADLDNFKAVNDRHGHQRGDLVLVRVAGILRDHVRGRDLAARIGGDEFAVFVEDIDLASAGHKAREILRAAAELVSLSGDPAHPLGLSIGVAFCPPPEAEDVADLIERADRAMYRAKRAGKGRAEVSASAGPEDTP